MPVVIQFASYSSVGMVGMDSMHTMDIDSAYIVRLTTGVETLVALYSSLSDSLYIVRFRLSIYTI